MSETGDFLDGFKSIVVACHIEGVIEYCLVKSYVANVVGVVNIYCDFTAGRVTRDDLLDSEGQCGVILNGPTQVFLAEWLDCVLPLLSQLHQKPIGCKINDMLPHLGIAYNEI